MDLIQRQAALFARLIVYNAVALQKFGLLANEHDWYAGAAVYWQVYLHIQRQLAKAP